MNFCAFTGRLGADPEVKTVKADKMVARLRVAVASGSKPKKDGERPEPAWLFVVAWGGLADACRALHKGDLILATGRQVTRQYEKNGQKQSIHEIVADSIAIDIRAVLRGDSDAKAPSATGNN